MEWSFLFFFNSALLGVGLAMDAFSVSMANGLHDPQMSRRRGVQIAGTFAIFQAVMPMTGWVCVHTIVELFSSFDKFIPWIALILLGYSHQHRRAVGGLHHLGVRLVHGSGLLPHRGDRHLLHL